MMNNDNVRGLSRRALEFEKAQANDYQSSIRNQIANERIKEARQRRQRDLAAEKRRNDVELDKRLADTLETEYRPKPFGGEGFQLHEENEGEKLLEQTPLETVKIPTKADPEIPQYLKKPEDKTFDWKFKVEQTQFTPTGKTSKADDGKQVKISSFDITKKDSPQDTMDLCISAINEAMSVANWDEIDAQQNLQSAINKEGDPEHGNFWGKLMDGMLEVAEQSLKTIPGPVGDIAKLLPSIHAFPKWAKNAIGHGAINKNEGEIKADAGEIAKYKELISRGMDMRQYTDNINRIMELSDRVEQLRKLEQNQDTQKLIQDTNSRIAELQKENVEMSKLADDASTYYGGNQQMSQSARQNSAEYALKAVNDIVAKYGYKNVPEEVRATLQKHMDTINNAVTKVEDEFKKERPKLLNRMADNIRELKSWQASGYNPDEEYMRIANSVTDFNFTDAKTYTHGMPGLIGSSMSFGGYQLASTALGLTAMAAATYGSGGLTLPIFASAGSTALGVVSGHYENDTELYDNYKEPFLKKLGQAKQYDKWLADGRKALGKRDASEDEVMYAMAAGIYEPTEKIKKIAATATYGLNNLYQNDMMAVVGNELFDASINFLGPIAKVARASMLTPGAKATRFQRMYKYMHEHPNMDALTKTKFAAEKFGEKFMDAEFGGGIFSSVAYPLTLVGRSLEAGAKMAMPTKWVNALNKTFSLSGDIMEKMPKFLLGSKAIGKNAAEFVGKVLGSGWSESIEEGKQYLNGKAFQDGSYAGASDSLMDSIINDIAGGSRAAYSFVGDMFGVTADRELIANMKGGFLGGFGHTATIQAVSAIGNTVQDLRVNDFVVNNVLAHKMADRATIQNNSYLARQTSPRQYEKVMNAFDALEDAARDAEEKNGIENLNYSVEDVQEQRRAYQRVFEMANSKNVQEAAKHLDIKPGTEKFGNYVGLVMWAKELAKDGVARLQENGKRANQMLTGFLTGVQNSEESLQNILSKLDYKQLLQIAGHIEEMTGEPMSPSTNLVGSIMQYVPQVRNYMDSVASLDALLTLRDQLEMVTEPTTADKRRLRSVNRQLKRLKENLPEGLKDIETADEMNRWVLDEKTHEVLRDFYREAANATTDIEEGAAMQYTLLGGKIAGVDFLTNPEMQQAYQVAQSEVKDRKKAALALIDRYINSVKDDEKLEQVIHDEFEKYAQEQPEVIEEEESPVEPQNQPVSPEQIESGIVEGAPVESASEGPEMAYTAPIQPESTSQVPQGQLLPEQPSFTEDNLTPEQGEIQPVIPEANLVKYDANEVDSDFGISEEDWSKVSAQTIQMVQALKERFARFYEKWHNQIISKKQYAGVHGNATKLQRQFDILKERVNRDIEAFDDTHYTPEIEHHTPTDDEIWEQLNNRQAVEEKIKAQFDEWVNELRMAWDNLISADSAKTKPNWERFHKAFANVNQLLDYAEQFAVQLGEGVLNTYSTIRWEFEQFTRLYSDDNNILEPPTVEPVSPTREEEWVKYTTTHTNNPTSAGYNVEDSYALDDPKIKFQDVSANPDFVENSIIWFTTRPYGRGNKIQMNVMYGGHQFSPIDVHTSEDASGKGNRWFSNVIRMIREGNGKAVIPAKSAIHRTNGIIENAQSLMTFEQMGLLNSENMYAIEYSSSQDTFCLIEYQKGEFGEPVPVAYIPGVEGGRSKHEVYKYSVARPESTKPANGGMVMMVRPPYPEASKDARVPINVLYTPLTEGDAQLIVDLLSGQYMSDPSDYGSHAMENQIFTEKGVGKGLTRMQVLRLLIRYKASNERYNEYQQKQRYVEYDPQDNRFVILHGNFGQGVEIPNGGRFNITEQADRDALKQFLLDHHNVSFAYEEMLRCRIGQNNEQFSHPLHGLIAFSETAAGQQIFRNGGQLTFGNSSISFDNVDLGDAVEHPEGISGLAWYMRKGFVMTSFIGFKNTLINFDEDTPLSYYEDGQVEQAPQQEEKPKTVADVIEQMDPEPAENIEDIDFDAYDPMTGKRAEVKFGVEEANKFLEKVLGETITDKDVTEKIHEIAKNTDGFVLGLTHWSGRLMFDPYAPQDTVYHEAFHKLVELVLGDRTRKMLYKAYAKKMHIKYKDEEELLKNEQVREGLAEEFRYYMDNRPTLKLSSLLHPFQTLKQVAKIMRQIGDFRLYTFYTLTRWGAIKNLYSINDAKRQRFLESHGAFAPFSINGHEFPSIINRYQYRNLRNTLKYFIFKTNDIGLAGEGIEGLRISKAAIKANKTYQLLIHSNAPGAKALEELVEGLEFIENDMRSYIAQSMGLTQHSHDDEENIEELEGGENPTGAAIGQHIRSSYEFSPLTRTSAKVKFLFSRVPKIRYAYKNGKKVVKNILNDEGLVEYFDLKYVFNTLVNHCHNCRNAQELLARLEKLGQSNAMFQHIHDKIVKPLYDQAQEGNADAEGLFAQMLVSLHAQKGEYVIGKAHRSANGTWGVTIESTDSDYNAREYKKVWSMLFAGGSEYIEQTTSGWQMAIRKGTQKRYSAEVFHNIYMFFNDLKSAVASGGTVRVHFIGEDNKATYRDLDVKDVEQFDQVKDEMCNTLQKLGIQFNKDELNYTLEQEFGSSDYTALSKMFERRDTKNITPFLNWLNGCYNPVTKSLNITKNGTLNGINIQNAVGSFGFVGMLADSKYRYKHDHDQLSVLATKGNRYYVISENNLITDITDDINAALDGDTKTVDKIKSFSYNWIQQGRTGIGSLVLKNMQDGKRINVVTLAGFRTDEKGDLGQDYAEISTAEDYITKCQLLMQGYLIFPTMSDKKTWTALKGVTIPGLTLTSRFTDLGSGRYMLSQDRQVLQQMLDYAKCELQSIRECFQQVHGYTDDQGVKHAPMEDKDKVANYHKNTSYLNKGTFKGHAIIQGARFGVLTGIYDEDDNWVSFNRIHEEGSEEYKDERKNLITAYEYFFGVPDSEHPGMYYVKTKAGDKNGSSGRYLNEQQLQEYQYELLSRSLQKQVEQELSYAESLGLIERVSEDPNVPVVLQYRNKLLDAQQIAAIEEQYKHIPDKNYRHSLAITTFLNRVSAASIISLNEVERLYAGHPAFFQWTYNENGDLQDRSVDQHKRLGGLISTGANNVLDIPGLPEKYVCAEVDNEMIGSKMQDEIHDLIEDGELRSAYLRSVLDKEGIGITGSNSEAVREKVKAIDTMSLDEIKEKLEKEHPDIYKIVLANAQKKAKDFTEDIDVADGAAYITDEMAEWLLRMVGSWDSKIERAFKILRGEEVDGKVYTSKDILELRQAYQDVLTTVIGNQKYTAYGFRFANGIAAPYYDKMALFPMFKVLSTGATAKVFDKMKKERINMLMINSAVKVGSQGSKPMNLTDFRVDDDPTNESNFVDGDVASQNWKPLYEDSFHFNKYEQEFKYIRKQFNTDPKEQALTKMGTQMTKVAMASLTAGREYLVVDGTDADGNKIYRTVTAQDLRDDVMDCINEISDLGAEKVRKRFMNDDNTVNIRELSDFLKEELANRGASQESIDAVSLTLDAQGEEVMYIPPVAQNSLEWIQSIVTSMINKNVIDINTPGAAFIQRSAWNMEGATNVRGAEDLAPNIYDGRELQMINEEGSMDCVLSIDFFDDIIPKDVVRDGEGQIVYETDEEGQFVYKDVAAGDGSTIKQRVAKTQSKSFKDARQWLIDNNIISGYKSNGQWSDASANIIGSRIPTQAQSSIHALRCVDVLPVVRDTIVLPKEFTKITGADFDIDKLFLSRLHYSVKNGKASNQFKEGTTEFYGNRLINNYIALLKDSASQENENKNRTAHSNHASIDGDTKLLKDIIKDLEESKQKDKLEPFTPYSLWANAATKTEFITGKFGIGPFALNNNSHILTMLYGVQFREDGFLGMLGMNRLDLAQDRYGNSILSWISGLINAHVDVAKDPYIARLNVNNYTYNIVNLMIRTGFGRDTFYFTTQPIMKEMAKAYTNAASQYGSENSRSKSRRQRDAVDKAVFDFLKKNFSLPSDVTSLKQAEKILDGYFKKTRGIDVLTAIQSLLSKDSDVLHQISKQGSAVNDQHERWNVGGVMMSTKEVQYLVYRAKQEFSPYEQQLSDLVKYSKIDTSKQGKNVVEQQAYRDGVEKLFEHEDYGLFKDLSDYYKNSYIQRKTRNALDLFSDIMASFTIESTPQFRAQMNSVMEALGERNPSADMYKAVSRQIMNYIRAGFFNYWAEIQGINIKGLVSGENTIADRLDKIRLSIMTDPAYADMRAGDGSIKNYLLAALVQGFNWKERIDKTNFNVGTEPSTHSNAKFIKTLNFMDEDQINDDDMAEAWDELLNDPTHPQIQEFAKDLIMYAFITSGGNSGSNLFKYIPNSWKLDSFGDGHAENGYAQYMQDQLVAYQTRDIIFPEFDTLGNPIAIDEIILNNWHDNRFVPVVKDEGFNKYYTGRPYNTPEAGPEVSIPIMLIKQNADPKGQTDDKYIKIRRSGSDPNSTRAYTIYKAVSYTTSGKLIYVMIDPKGNSFPQGNTIYEMRRRDSQSRESASIASVSRDFTMSIMVARDALNIEQNSIADIIRAFINTVQARTDIGEKATLLDLFTKDKELRKILDDATIFGISDENTIEYGSLNPEEQVSSVKFYTGDIQPSENTIFVFGSNPEGRHGAGAAKVARLQFGAIYGQGEGLQGNSYAIPTKDLRVTENRGYRSISKESIIESIKKMYDVAKQNPDKQFKVAYRNTGDQVSLNGYSGDEMIAMFKQAGTIPENVLFSKEWADRWDDIDTVAENREEAEQNGNRTYRPSEESLKTKEAHKFDVISAIKTYLGEYAVEQQNPEFTAKTDVKQQKETTTIAALEYIRQNGSSEFYKKAAETLLKFAKIHPASVLFTPNVDYGASGHASFDPHNPQDAFVELFTSNSLYKAAPEGAILHEIAHNVSQFIVRIIEDNSDAPISKYMEYIQAYILSETAKNGALNTFGDYGAAAMEMVYGFKSPSEFVAEFMSNPMFCDILKQIPAMEKQEFDNIFDEVIHWICKVIANIFKDNNNSVYEQIKPIVEGLMEIQSKLDYSNTEWASQLSELLDDEQRFLTKTEVTRLRLKTKAYELLNKAKYVRKQSSGYFIQKGELTIRKDGVARYDIYDESLPSRYTKIENLLKDAGINPEFVLNGYNKFTGEIYFKSIYDEDNMFDKYNQYKLDGPDAFSELVRMQNDDPELFAEYIAEHRKDLNC